MLLQTSPVVSPVAVGTDPHRQHLRYHQSLSRFPKSFSKNKRLVFVVVSSAAGSSIPNDDLNPYTVLGVSPIGSFDAIKAAYSRKRKEAERRGDEVTVARLEKAYDAVMLSQLTNRKKGVTFGSFKVSKDIKYADRQPLLPWGPRSAKSSKKDVYINMAISSAFSAWVLIQRSVEWKPIQFLGFAFVYRIFEKLKASEQPVSPTFTEEEDEGRMMRMGKRLLRSLSLVFGCIAVTSLAYTGILNLIELASGFVPAFLYNNQEVLVTIPSAALLFVMASYYR